MRKPPWWWKDKRQSQAEQIKTFRKSRRHVAQTLRRTGKAHVRPHDADIQYAMQLAALHAIEARLPKPNFRFSVSEVIAVYKQKQGEPGKWFELEDGRVYDRLGDADTTDPDAYET